MMRALACIAMVLATIRPGEANVAVRVVSRDPYGDPASYHQTEVEPDTFAFHRTIVGVFQVGRFADGGASNVGWTTSTDRGRSWHAGFLPGTTAVAEPPGAFARVTDPSVAYDAKHRAWLVVTLASSAASGFSGDTILVNRSTDGGTTFGNPIVVATASGASDFDKTFIGCDDAATSRFSGTCYAEWDDTAAGDALHMSTSDDGGVTWREAVVPPRSHVIGGIPLAQPDGRVVVPMDDAAAAAATSYVSTDGGGTYVGPFAITAFHHHDVAGGLRAPNLVSADVDAAGTVYVVWSDCSARPGCASNDIALSTSSDGVTWTAPVRIPIDGVTTGVDHFLPGLGVDHATHGGTARLGVTYWFYPDAGCTEATCELSVGFIGSRDGGRTWGRARRLSGPFPVTWLPRTGSGFMAGDYTSTSWVAGRAHTVYGVATAGPCALGQGTGCRLAMVSPRRALRPVAPFRPVEPLPTLP
jgi:hypothetical protein